MWTICYRSIQMFDTFMQNVMLSFPSLCKAHKKLAKKQRMISDQETVKNVTFWVVFDKNEFKIFYRKGEKNNDQ